MTTYCKSFICSYFIGSAVEVERSSLLGNLLCLQNRTKMSGANNSAYRSAIDSEGGAERPDFAVLRTCSSNFRDRSLSEKFNEPLSPRNSLGIQNEYLRMGIE